MTMDKDDCRGGRMRGRKKRLIRGGKKLKRGNKKGGTFGGTEKAERPSARSNGKKDDRTPSLLRR